MALYSGWAIALAIVMESSTVGWFYLVIIVISTLGGLALRHFSLNLSTARQNLEEMEARHHQARLNERLRLARELHDGVAHALSIIAAQGVAYGNTDDPTELRTTTSRIITEAATNILRYAKPATACRFLVQVDHDLVRIRVTSQLRDHDQSLPTEQSTGLGLVGLDERVALTGGRFPAQAESDEWHVCADLPLHPANIVNFR